MSPVVKKKEERKKIPGKYLLLIYTILCVLLIFVTINSDIQGTVIEETVGIFIVPLQKGISQVSARFVALSDERKTIEELRAENNSLRQEIAELTQSNSLLLQDQYELTQLRELYQLDRQYSDYTKVGARIIASGTSSWFDSFLVDKGRDDGIQVGMNVLAGSGLVGIVEEVGSNWARVMTIISNDSNVSATVLHTQDHLIVSGDMSLIEQGVISFSQLLDDDNEVKRGDKVVTSNISDRYLPDLLIGYIASVEQDSNQLTCSGQITPTVDFEHLTEVLIITTMKTETGGD